MTTTSLPLPPNAPRTPSGHADINFYQYPQLLPMGNACRKVAYLGPAGTISHQVALQLFGSWTETGFTFHPCPTPNDVFGAILAGDTGWAVVPYFNTTGGTVESFYPTILERASPSWESLTLCACVDCHIEHDLLGCGRIELVRTIYSKGEALKQCRRTLERLAPKATLVPAPSTSAAAVLAERKGESAAAIGSRSLLQFHAGLRLLQENVEDEVGNTTRFLVFVRKEIIPGPQRLAVVMNGTPLERHTFLTFTSSQQRDILARLLGAARKWGIGTTALSGRITNPNTFEMRFLVELTTSPDAYKTKFFLSEVAHLRPIVIGAPVVGPLASFGDFKVWAKHSAGQVAPPGKNGDSSRLPRDVGAILAGTRDYSLIEHQAVKTAEEVWGVLGVGPEQILNTQVLEEEATGELVFACVRGDRKVDERKLALHCNGTFRRLRPHELTNRGMSLGTVSPLTAPPATSILVDPRVLTKPEILMGSGNPEISVAMPADVTLWPVKSRVVDIAMGTPHR